MPSKNTPFFKPYASTPAIQLSVQMQYPEHQPGRHSLPRLPNGLQAVRDAATGLIQVIRTGRSVNKEAAKPLGSV